MAKIALQVSYRKRESLDKALETMKGDMGKVGTLESESSFMFV